MKGLTSEPNGSLTFYFIKLPDFIQDSDYFKIDVFSDKKRAMKIIESYVGPSEIQSKSYMFRGNLKRQTSSIADHCPFLGAPSR